MLDQDLRLQLKQYFELLENEVVLKVSLGSDQVSIQLKDFINELTKLSDKMIINEEKLDRTPSFSINSVNENLGITFAGIPLGHELGSFVLAMLHASGRKPKLDDDVITSIQNINQKLHFETYVSLTCHNCPDVVQALNMMSILNPLITHTMIDGAVFTNEVEEKNIMAVPTVYLNGKHFSSGRMEIEEILDKLGVALSIDESITEETFDVLVIGGGPAGTSAAIYAARKGIKTAMIAERIGGQVLDTMNIENLIGTNQILGPALASNFNKHLNDYNIKIINNQLATKIIKEDIFKVELNNGLIIKSKTVIVATGAKWRNLNVLGEHEFKNKGVAYCPHCDGPMFKDKPIAVIGGGNSGVEAAIDLANTSSFVTLIEFLPELKADKVLQDHLYNLENVKVIKNAQVTEIIGDKQVNSLSYLDRTTNEKYTIELNGVFVQIGLAPNTAWLDDFVEKNRFGEIIVDSRGATNIPGLFAAGDCTTSPYKQIVISMGSGATAALSAFDYLIKN